MMTKSVCEEFCPNTTREHKKKQREEKQERAFLVHRLLRERIDFIQASEQTKNLDPGTKNLIPL